MLGKQWQARNSLTVGKHLPLVAVGSTLLSPRATYYRTIQYVYWIISFVRALSGLCPASFLSIYLATPCYLSSRYHCWPPAPMDQWIGGKTVCQLPGVCMCVGVGEGSRDKDSIWTNGLSWHIELGSFSQCFYNNCHLSFGNLLATGKQVKYALWFWNNIIYTALLNSYELNKKKYTSV